ncbi:MAG: phosphate signaling complex protein PhoU [Caulobacterales bacterium]|jgi:phosphate transport system protein
MTMSTPQKEIDGMIASVSRMGGVAESLVSDAIAAVVRRDTGLAQEVIAGDAVADAAHRDIERQVTRFLALRQPIATDLRQALAALKISAELERVGDLAKNIAKRTLALNLAEPIAITRGIERMGRNACAQLKQVLDAYSAGDVTRAVAVWVQDEDIDAHYNSLFRELLTYMMEDPRTISSCAHLLFVAKNVERIGDHCTNIAETIHYLVTGAEIENERPKGDDPAAEDN